MNPTFISIVVPVYNEERNIIPFLKRLVPSLDIFSRYEIIFVCDPSLDKTEEIIIDQINNNSFIKLISFSRRFGQPAATMAGIFNSKGDYCAVIDVDLQDPPELIKDMYLKLTQGYEVVYAKRRSRKGETLFKRFISHIGYMLINKLSDVKIPRNTGDFRIMTRRVIEELRNLNESHGFLRGLVAYVGFNQTFIEYDRDFRYAGSGNYNPFTGSLKIGLNGLISFSSKPLFVMSIFGFFLSILSFLLGSWYLVQKLLGVNLTPGLSTTVIIISFFAGVQLLGLGLIGEYVGRIYDEVKRRPMYIVDKKINFNDGQSES
ncbi:glycosyltransferase family 2 protein [Polynucleobacter paneuropaeus]|nr:glycosyltransferase family 2 protein [Polynucleobacter paneuropaeus]